MFELMDWAKKIYVSTKKRNIKELVEEFDDVRSIERLISNFQSEWYGTTDVSKIVEEKTSFLFAEQSKILLDELTKQTKTIDVSILNQKKNILFNDRELGIFSFDLASLGLIPVVEYYSPILKEVVNPNMVRSEKKDGKLEFYHIEVPFVPEHKLIDKGTHLFSTILGINVERDAAIVRADTNGEILLLMPQQDAVSKHQVEQRQVLNKNGSKKFSSTNKKSFIFLENVKKKLPQIDIILSVSINWKKKATTEILYNALPVVALMKVMSDNNIKFRIFYENLTGLRKNKKDENLVEYNTIVSKLKDINDPPDFNMVSIICSDSRFIRGEAFKVLTSTFDVNNQSHLDIDRMGYPLNDYKLLTTAFNSAITASKDFGTADPDTFKGEDDSTKIVFPVSLSQEDAFEAYGNAIKKIKGMLQ